MAKMASEIARFQNNPKQLNPELRTVANNLDRTELKWSRLEESNQSLQLEAEDMMRKMTIKDQELAQKHNELEKFQIRILDEQRALQIFSVSSNISAKNLQNKSFSLKKIKDEHEDVVFQKMEHSNALEHGIHRLRDEIKEINGRYQAMKIQVESIGMKTSWVCLRSHSKSLEEFYQLLKNEKSTIIGVREALVSQLESVELRLENLEKRFSNLEQKYTSSEDENEAMLDESDELRSSIVSQLTIFSSVCESFIADKYEEMKALKDLNRYRVTDTELRDEVKKMADKKLMEELQIFKDSNDLLTREIVTGNNFVRQKVEELSQTRQELKNMRELNAKLCNEVEELKMERKRSSLVRESLEIENLELCMNVHSSNDEITRLNEINQNLKSEIGVLSKENISSELQERKDGFEAWDAEADSFYFDLQISSVREVFLENKLHEVTQVCVKLGGECAEKDTEIRNLKRSIMFMESERDDETTVLCTKEKENETMADRGTYNMHFEVRQRVKQIEEFISEETSDNEIMKNDRKFDRVSKPHAKRLENRTLMKDIPLDQVLDFLNDQMLRLWEIVEKNIGQNPTPDEMHKVIILPLETDPNKFEEKRYSDIEKELRVDIIERSSSIGNRSQGGKKRKILQRLASDAQKLTNIQSTVHDLNKKLEKKDWIKQEISIDYQKVCKQVKEIEETVTHLVTMNDQLTKNIEHSPESEGENIAGNRVIERARKGSEKIGRLCFEVQNIQLMLIKLEEEKNRTWKARFSKNKTGIRLKDFIYNSSKNREKQNKRKKKKNWFRGCNGGSTDED